MAEVGTDAQRFPTAGHLASRAGMCPGHHESAGKRRSGRTRKSSPWLRATLIQLAHAAGRTKHTSLASHYHRLAARRGKKRAAVAAATASSSPFGTFYAPPPPSTTTSGQATSTSGTETPCSAAWYGVWKDSAMPLPSVRLRLPNQTDHAVFTAPLGGQYDPTGTATHGVDCNLATPTVTESGIRRVGQPLNVSEKVTQ